MGYHYFRDVFWDQKLPPSHTELYQLIPVRRTIGLALN